MATGIKVPSETREKVLLGAGALYWSHWGRFIREPFTDFHDEYHREAYQCLSLMELADANLRNVQLERIGQYTPEELFDQATSRFWECCNRHKEYMDAADARL